MIEADKAQEKQCKVIAVFKYSQGFNKIKQNQG